MGLSLMLAITYSDMTDSETKLSLPTGTELGNVLKDKKILDFPSVNIKLKIESRMKRNILRKICGIKDCLH